MTEKIERMKELYKAYRETDKRIAELEERFDKDFTNEQLEMELDDYYTYIHYPAFVKLENAIKELTGIDQRGVIIKMIESEKFEKLMA